MVVDGVPGVFQMVGGKGEEGNVILFELAHFRLVTGQLPVAVGSPMGAVGDDDGKPAGRDAGGQGQLAVIHRLGA